jgi:hypothetical protein
MKLSKLFGKPDEAPRVYTRSIFSSFGGAESAEAEVWHLSTTSQSRSSAKEDRHQFLLIAHTSFIILVIILFFLIFPQIQPENKSDKFSIYPELAIILSNNKDARLSATRSLAERVGVEQSLEVLKDSGLPFTGEGHLAVHQIGFYAYKKYGFDSILHCKDYYLYACYHGAIIEAATDSGFEAISKMTDRCRDYLGRFFQCVHASGHAIMAIWNYNLPEALKTCDKLFEKEIQYPDTLSSCHNGAFMENLFGVHDWNMAKVAQREWLSDDPYFPCNYFGEKYQKGCWLNQAARIYQMNNGDIVKTAKTCEQISNNQYKIWCYDNLARQIHPITNGNIHRVFELCEFVGILWRDNCVVVNAGAYFSVGGREEAVAICNLIPYVSKNDCYRLVTSQILADNLSSSQKNSLCLKMRNNYDKNCLSQIKN